MLPRKLKHLGGIFMAWVERFTFVYDANERRIIAAHAPRLQESNCQAVRSGVIEAACKRRRKEL